MCFNKTIRTKPTRCTSSNKPVSCLDRTLQSVDKRCELEKYTLSTYHVPGRATSEKRGRDLVKKKIWLKNFSDVMIIIKVSSYSQFEVMRDALTYHRGNSIVRDSYLDVPLGICCILLFPNSQSSICNIQKKPDLL